MDEQERINELIKKGQEAVVRKARELEAKIAVFQEKIEQLRNEKQAIERAPKKKEDFLGSMKKELAEGKARWREFMKNQVELAQVGKVDLFTEPGVNLSLFTDRTRWKWLPLWVSESDLEAIIGGMSELPGAISAKEREGKIAVINKAIAEVEKEIEKLLS